MPDILIGPVDGGTAVHTFMEKEIYVGKVHGKKAELVVSTQYTVSTSLLSTVHTMRYVFKIFF
jgi:hypothetical protein